ncbi:MAG: serine kinase [Anaerolineae bacterium]|nr:serine kinase [Anaerolineae bacterium]
MYIYSAYGLGIQSELELPELVAGTDTNGTVTIHFGKVEPLPAEVDSQFHSFWATPNETCLCFQGNGAYLVRNGSEIIIQPFSNVDERVIRLSVLGPALSMLLHQRGLLVLHGSAIVINGQAVSFLGSSGDGKSTMAGVLNRRGHPLVADDLSVVDFDPNGNPLLLPGFPQLKLWPEAVTSLGDDLDSLARLHPAMEKRARHIEQDDFSPNLVPLRRLYVLHDADSLSIEPVQSQQAFIELVRHSHDALLLRQTNSALHHFRQCSQLVSRIQLCYLKRPRSLAALTDVARLIEDNLALTNTAP